MRADGEMPSMKNFMSLSSILSIYGPGYRPTLTTVGPLRSKNYPAILTVRNRILERNPNPPAISITNPSWSFESHLEGREPASAFTES